MILIFLKDCPTRHNPEKSFKENSQVVFSDYEYGNQLIKDGFAKKMDERFSFIKEIRKEKIKSITKEKGENNDGN